MKKRFSEEQIVTILQEAERSDTDREVIRKYNISDVTFYRWKKLYGGMGQPCYRIFNIKRDDYTDTKKITRY